MLYEEKKTEFQAAMSGYATARENALDEIQKVRGRIRNEKNMDDLRISELESILKDCPREELRRINQQLEDANRQKDSSFWVDYYRSQTGTLHDSEKSRLEKRKAKIEAELPMTPFEPEELELSKLRRKTYSVTADERKRLEETAAAVGAYAARIRETGTALKASFEQAAEEMKAARADTIENEKYLRISSDIMNLVNILGDYDERAAAAIL